MTTCTFKAQALTPIHIGSGREIDPLEYTVVEDSLVQFNPAQVISSLPDTEQARFLNLIEECDLKKIQSFLRTKITGTANEQGFGRIGASRNFIKEFEQKANNPDRQFRVDMMLRNPVSGKVIIPGSSIKGAIRTAIINYFANLERTTSAEVHAAVKKASSNERAKVLEEKALNYDSKDTESDFFRLIHVEDVSLPDSATRIDRAVNWNPNKAGSEKILIWVERIISVADTWKAPVFDVKIRIDLEMAKHPEVSRILGRVFDWWTVFKACNSFYWGRMKAEADKFYGRADNSPTWQAIHGCFPRAKHAHSQEIIILDPSSPYWCSSRWKRKRFLLRIGRFSHFESLSVDNLREGYNVQARKPIKGMGATRTLCVMENGKPPMPFGWLILWTDEIT